jgi:hypothetical protein
MKASCGLDDVLHSVIIAHRACDVKSQLTCLRDTIIVYA